MSETIPPEMQPVFDRHAVPDSDRLFLFQAFDRLIEEDYDNETIAGAIAHGVVEADSYEDLLQMHDRGHRRNKAWFRSAAFEDATPTKKARALVRDLAAAHPGWQEPTPTTQPQQTGGPT